MTSLLKAPTTTVVTNPTMVTTAETVIATLTAISPSTGGEPIALTAWADITLAASTTGLTLRVRRQSLTGTVVATAGPIAATASARVIADMDCTDFPGDVAGFVYVLTAQAAAASANATVNAVSLAAVYG